MLRRRWLLAAIPLAGCRTEQPPLVLPPTMAEVWHLKDSSAQPASSAPELVRSIGTRGWTAGTYEGPGTIKIEIYELASSAGGLEMVQKWRAQAGAVVFYTDRYFAVVRSDTPDRARLTAFITALQKLLGVAPTRSSSG